MSDLSQEIFTEKRLNLLLGFAYSFLGRKEGARLTIQSRKDYQLVSSSNKYGSQASFYMSERNPKSLILISVSENRISYMEIRGEFSLLDFGSRSELGIR